MKVQAQESISICPQSSDPNVASPASHNDVQVFSKRKAVILALTLSTLGGLLVSEVALRTLWHNPYRYESPDRLVKLAIHHPNTDHQYSRALINGEHPDARLRTDARSYILPSFQYEDPDVTITFLGGSTTECSAVEEDIRFPALVSKIFAEQGLKVNTLNAARAGNTLHDSLNVLLNHVSRDKPDIIVLMHASNDIGVLLGGGDYRSRSGDFVSFLDIGKWVFQIASSHSYLAGAIRHGATSSIIQPTDPRSDWRHNASLITRVPSALYRQRLKAFVHLSRDFGIEPILMTEPFSGSTNSLTPKWVDRTAQDLFNTIIRQVGQEEEVLVVDLVKYLQEQVPEWNKEMNIFYDAIHVTDKGSAVYADYITDRLLPVIVKLRKDRSPKQ